MKTSTILALALAGAAVNAHAATLHVKAGPNGGQRLQEALTTNSGNGKYNEVVVDAQFAKKNLPHSLLAVFFTNEGGRAGAADVRSNFLRAFGLTPAQFPLVRWDLQKGFSYA